MSSRPPLTQPPAPTVAVLIRRLLTRLDRPGSSAPAARPAGKRSAAPPGQRSGEGSSSVVPYLNDDLQTRPGALED